MPASGQVETAIAARPPSDGREWDSQCARCGSSTFWVDCYLCGGEGWESRYDEDPLWYDEDELYRCDHCRGCGGWEVCASGPGEDDSAETPSWCQENPAKGREEVEAGTIEWFVIRRATG